MGYFCVQYIFHKRILYMEHLKKMDKIEFFTPDESIIMENWILLWALPINKLCIIFFSHLLVSGVGVWELLIYIYNVTSAYILPKSTFAGFRSNALASQFEWKIYAFLRYYYP